MRTVIAIGAMGRIWRRGRAGRDRRMPCRALGEGGFFWGHQLDLLYLVFSEFFIWMFTFIVYLLSLRCNKRKRNKCINIARF